MLVRMPILVVTLSLLAILSALSVRIGGQIVLELRSKAAKRMQNFAYWVSE